MNIKIMNLKFNSSKPHSSLYDFSVSVQHNIDIIREWKDYQKNK